MRIATFNLENLGGDEGESELAHRLPLLRPQLQRLAADVVCLQEVNSAKRAGERHLDALDTLLDGGPYASFHRVHTVRAETDRPADRHNLVILSRWPIAAHAQIRNHLVPAPAWRPVTAAPPAQAPAPLAFERPLLHATIALPSGHALEVVNVHLRAPLAAPVAGQKQQGGVWRSQAGWAEGFVMAALKRSAQALEARILIDRLFAKNPEALVAAAGDFNCEGHETPLRVVAGEVDDTGNPGLAETSLVPLERSLAETQRFSLLHRGRRVMFDHILVSRPLLGRYREIEVHNETLGDAHLAQLFPGEPRESAHAPVVAEFGDP